MLHEVDAARALVAGEAVAGVGQQFLGQLVVAGLDGDGLHHRLDLLSHFLVGDAHHGHIGHLGVHDQDVLDLLGIDVDAAADDHEGGPVGQVKVALVIDVAHIAKGGPVGVLRVLGFLGLAWVLQVLKGHLRHFEIDDAGLANGQFGAAFVADVDHAKDRPAHGAGVRQPFLRRGVGEAVEFRGAVVFVDDRPPPVEHLLLDAGWTGGGGVDGHSMGGQVVAPSLLLRQLQHAGEHGRHPLAMGDLVLFDGLECA